MQEQQCNPDWDALDFDEQDFETSVEGDLGLRHKLFNDLPHYFKNEDTYKNEFGEGLLQRFMYVFGYHIDFEIIPKIECYLKIIDAQITGQEYLTHLSDVLGNPPDIFNDPFLYRNLLSYIVAVYKIKGTKKAYELFFSVLGFDIELTEIEPTSLEISYDSDSQYDSGHFYDENSCVSCSYYDITFYYKDSSNTVLGEDILNRLKEAIKFNEPINAKLRNLTFAIRIEDEINTAISEDYTPTEIVLPIYDNNKEYDDNEIYDA